MAQKRCAQRSTFTTDTIQKPTNLVASNCDDRCVCWYLTQRPNHEGIYFTSVSRRRPFYSKWWLQYIVYNQGCTKTFTKRLLLSKLKPPNGRKRTIFSIFMIWWHFVVIRATVDLGPEIRNLPMFTCTNNKHRPGRPRLVLISMSFLSALSWLFHS